MKKLLGLVLAVVMLAGCLVGCSESIDPASRPAILGGETSRTEKEADTPQVQETQPQVTEPQYPTYYAEPGFYRAVDVGVLSIGFFDDDELFEVRVNTDMDGIAAFGIVMPYTLDGIERVRPFGLADALDGPAADASTDKAVVFAGSVTECEFLEAGTAVLTAKIDGLGSITFGDDIMEFAIVLMNGEAEMFNLSGVTLSNEADEE